MVRLQRIRLIRYVTIATACTLFFLVAVSTQALYAAENSNNSGNEQTRGAGPQEWSGDLAPLSATDWSRDRAAHLLERAGLGGTPQEIDRLAAMTPEQAVQWLVQYQAVENDHLLPFDESGIFDPPVEPFPKSRADAVRIARATGEAMGVKPKPSGDRPLQPVVDRFFYWLRADRLEVWRAQQWWAKRMLTTNRPLEEKLALFWHGHFATSDDKLRDYRKSLKQLALFRTAGNGNFRDLLIGVAKDPAMLVYLDAGENIKGSPNENFSREILELFTMGVGNYTEKDIREAARAFTGWTNDSLTFVVKPELHDEEEKTFLGQSGNFDGTDIINIVLEQDVTARFIAAKLYRYFVHTEPSAHLVTQLGKQFKEENYDIASLLHTIFLARDFYSPHAYGTQIKSPVHLVVSTYRKLGLTDIPGVPDFNTATRTLGQELFHPPNVAGWEGGRSWVTPALLLERGNFARDILFPDMGNFKAPDQQMPEQNRKVAVKIAQGFEITQATLEGEGNAMESTGMENNNAMAMDNTNMDANAMNEGSMSSSSPSTSSSMSTFNQMAGADEDYNTRYGSTHGWMEAFRRVKPVPRHAAQLNVASMITDAGLATTSEVVDYFLARLLRTSISAEDRAALITFLTQELGTNQIQQTVTYLEEPARLLLHLIMSTPEYQLG
jgi:hypothetical protein